eukprot:jgi/Phyca11/17482/fgenesh1_pg.PHYCAscaffold_28_\
MEHLRRNTKAGLGMAQTDHCFQVLEVPYISLYAAMTPTPNVVVVEIVKKEIAGLFMLKTLNDRPYNHAALARNTKFFTSTLFALIASSHTRLPLCEKSFFGR